MLFTLRITLFIVISALLGLVTLPALGQQLQSDEAFFPKEDFVQTNPTLPNAALDFTSEKNESCCVKDYEASKPLESIKSIGTASTTATQKRAEQIAKSDFEKNNPRYFAESLPAFLVQCQKYEDMPQNASNTPAPDLSTVWNRSAQNTIPITSYSMNVSKRAGAEYFTDPKMHNTSDFHVELAGGGSFLKLQDVNSYSVCMARGSNVAMVANTDNASILSYNGNDHIYLAGHNTNMLTRTGAGEDTIEIYQAQPHNPQLAMADSKVEGWIAYNIYKTAISGSTGVDTVVIKGTPFATKWCHIGSYQLYGETFHVVEFALPPSVTEGPRRQRMNIGQSVEYVVFKGRKYALNEFLAHGTPQDATARSIPLDAPLTAMK